jgi:excisionase family DNA binding protein
MLTATVERIDVQPIYYRRRQAAQRLNVSLRQIDILVSTKKLRTVKIGKRRLISEDAIQAFASKLERNSK